MPQRLRLVGLEDDLVVEVLGDLVTVVGSDRRARVTADGSDEYRVEIGATVERAVVALEGDAVWVQIAGEVFRFQPRTGTASATRDDDALTPPMSARVAKVLVSPGQSVRAGDLLVSLEAMKMELPLRAPRDAIVRAIHCREGDIVHPGVAVVELGDVSVFHSLAGSGDRAR